MNNRKLYPFKRNNYYYGKLITVRDFVDEQKYFNNKRRINNLLTNGIGIVSGLTVIVIDDKTISVEAGLALDCTGREIIVAESVTKNLNVIDGFDTLDDEKDVFLCIEYADEPDEPVYSVTKGVTDADDKSEFNKIKEGYTLRLTNAPLLRRSVMEDIALSTHIIFEESGVKISVTAPKYVSKGHRAVIKVNIEKSKFIKNIEVDFFIRADSFKDENGESIVHVFYRDAEPSSFGTSSITYIVTADNIETETELIYEKGSVIIGNSVNETTLLSHKITITGENVYDSLMKRFLLTDFEQVAAGADDIPVYLAKLQIVKSGDGCIIKEIAAVPYEQFIVSNETLYRYIRSLHYKAPPQKVISAAAPVETKTELPISMSSGTEQIEIEMKSKNKTYFSAQIAHGLGTGDVIIHVGVENVENKNYMDDKKIIFGDSSILTDTQHEPSIPAYSTAIIVYPDKQTFRIAIKPFANFDTDEITVKWWAFKNKAVKETDYAEADGVTVSINEKSVVIAPHEKFKFTALVLGTDNKECKWSVMDNDGGEIDINGVYIAPDTPGVYQIMAQSVKYPHKRTTTFVVVK